MKVEINTQLLPVKIIYFLTLAGLACLIPFLPVYMHHIGLTAAEIGVIRGLEPLVNFIFCPLWGTVADKFNKHKPILIGSLLLSGFFLFVTLFIPNLNFHPLKDPNMAPLFTVNTNDTITNSNKQWQQQNVNFGIGCNATKSYKLLSAFCNNFYFSDDQTMSAVDTCDDICHSSAIHFEDDFKQQKSRSRTNYQTYDSIIQNQTYDCHVCLRQRNGYISYVKDVFEYGSGIEIINPLIFQNECHLLEHHDDADTTKQVNSSRCDDSHNVTQCPSMTHTTRSHRSISQSTECLISYECICLPKITKSDNFKEREIHAATFSLMLFFVLLTKMFNCNVFPILDSTVMELLQDARREYGKQKVWGTVGWAVLAVISGAMIDGIGNSSRVDRFGPAFYLYYAFMIAAALVAAVIVFPPHTSNRTMFLNSLELLRQPTIVSFLLLVFVLGFSFGIIGTFLFLYLEELGSLYTLMGLTLTVTCISEIPVFFFSAYLIKFLGHNNVLYVTLLCYALRFLGYSFLRNPWLVVPLELLHGITYGAAWATCSGCAAVLAPPGMAANLQSLFSVTHMGLGKGLGALFGGVIYYWLGGRNLFRISAGLCLVSAIVFFLLQTYVIKKGLRYSRFHDICDGSDKLEESRDESAPSEFDQCRLEIEESDLNSPSVDPHGMQLALGTIADMQYSEYSDPSDLPAIEMSMNGKRKRVQDDDESPGSSGLTEMMRLEGRLPAIGREDSGLEGAIRLPALGEEDDYIDDDTTTLILPHGGKSTTV